MNPIPRVLAAIVLVGACRETRARPEATPPPDAAPPAVAVAAPPAVAATPAVDAPPAVDASTPETVPEPAAPMSPELTARAERWRQRIHKRVWGRLVAMAWPVGAITLENHPRGAFDVVRARVPAPIVAGGGDDTFELLVVTKSGELALQNGPDTVGLVDLDGDGRDELVLKDVTVVADKANGPLLLPIGAKGGAYGWRDARIGTHEGKPALFATTETNTSREIGAVRAGGYIQQESKGILEEVILVWDGKRLADAGRRPLETEAQAAARAREFAEEARAEEDRIAAARAPCYAECRGKCGDAGPCFKTCKARCDGP